MRRARVLIFLSAFLFGYYNRVGTEAKAISFIIRNLKAMTKSMHLVRAGRFRTYNDKV